ncbi:hypothetical protein DCC81_20880 [Chitinophaga parva]|uniref:Uncharacterized protein n=1 Tax=Chitinophaga parva TaxID=2169414 RepID=A0A2T7BCQ6_9BACT|nr:hypothetical protein [Chitinophaga parva]PUZ22878.1 hypothetical protein DCC81_20880 [Chitinophaga parva]
MTAQRIIQHIFKEPGLEKVTQWELEKLVTDYPFFTGARALLAKRAYQRSSDLQHEAVIKALLYTSAPHYLYQFVQSPPDVITPAPVIDLPENEAVTDEATAAQHIDHLVATANAGAAPWSEATTLPSFTEPTPEATEELAAAGEISVTAYEAIAADAAGEKTPEPLLDTHALDTLETGHLSVDAYEAIHADEDIPAAAPAPDTHTLDTLEAGQISVAAYEAITTLNEEATETPAHPAEAPYEASHAEAILETTTGSFGATAPELAAALTQPITPADEKPRLTFHEEMEAFRRSLAAQQEQEEAGHNTRETAADAALPEQSSVETPAATVPASQPDNTDFRLRMEAFRQSLLASEDTAEEGATDQSVSEAEAAVLQNFNVHSFQDELAALKNSFTVEENTGESLTDTLQAGAFAAAETLEATQPAAPEATDATLETGAIAPPHAQQATPTLGEVSQENAATLAQALETGAREAIVETEDKEGLEATLETASEGLPDFMEETPVHPAATLAAEAATLADNEPAFTSGDTTAAMPAFTSNVPAANTPDITEQELQASDIQLVSDAINDHLPVPGTLPAPAEDAPIITTWMPPQQSVSAAAPEQAFADAPETAAQDAAPEEAFADAPETAAQDAAPAQAFAQAPETSDQEAAPVQAFAQAPETAAQDAAPQHLTEGEGPENYEEGPIKIYPLEMPEETDLTFQPLYSEDYFAYKKLADPVAAEKMSEKGEQEMKSFTNWLRTMKDSFAEKTQKDWYHEQLHRVYEEEEESGISERVEKMALQSIMLDDDIVSETLAEIWARQRQHQKAIQIYKKLSLLNPGKSAYFAQKINELQSDINK